MSKHWEIEHDKKLIETLQSAHIVETRPHLDEWVFALAYLKGRVSFIDGVMYWYVLTSDRSGEMSLDQHSYADLIQYGREQVRRTLIAVAEEAIAAARRRLEQDTFDTDVFGNCTTDQQRVLWAAMMAMVYDLHAPQDQMTQAEWGVAKAICDRLTTILDAADIQQEE